MYRSKFWLSSETERLNSNIFNFLFPPECEFLHLTLNTGHIHRAQWHRCSTLHKNLMREKKVLELFLASMDEGTYLLFTKSMAGCGTVFSKIKLEASMSLICERNKWRKTSAPYWRLKAVKSHMNVPVVYKSWVIMPSRNAFLILLWRGWFSFPPGHNRTINSRRPNASGMICTHALHRLCYLGRSLLVRSCRSKSYFPTRHHLDFLFLYLM